MTFFDKCVTFVYVISCEEGHWKHLDKFFLQRNDKIEEGKQTVWWNLPHVTNKLNAADHHWLRTTKKKNSYSNLVHLHDQKTKNKKKKRVYNKNYIITKYWNRYTYCKYLKLKLLIAL